MKEYIERAQVLKIFREWRKQYHPDLWDGGIFAAYIQALPAYILTEERGEDVFVGTGR